MPLLGLGLGTSRTKATHSSLPLFFLFFSFEFRAPISQPDCATRDVTIEFARLQFHQWLLALGQPVSTKSMENSYLLVWELIIQHQFAAVLVFQSSQCTRSGDFSSEVSTRFPIDTFSLGRLGGRWGWPLATVTDGWWQLFAVHLTLNDNFHDQPSRVVGSVTSHDGL